MWVLLCPTLIGLMHPLVWKNRLAQTATRIWIKKFVYARWVSTWSGLDILPKHKYTSQNMWFQNHPTIIPSYAGQLPSLQVLRQQVLRESFSQNTWLLLVCFKWQVVCIHAVWLDYGIGVGPRIWDIIMAVMVSSKGCNSYSRNKIQEIENIASSLPQHQQHTVINA